MLCYNLGIKQLKPVLEEMSSHLTDDDKERLREAFGLQPQHEQMPTKEHDHCFIESLIDIESQETEEIDLGKSEFHPDNETK